MSASYLWWILAVVLGAVELLTGTFYLLILALGLVAAGVAASLGATLTVQLVSAAIICLVGWGALRLRRRGSAAATSAADSLDAGARIEIDRWDRPRETQVRYRGAVWQAELSAATLGAGQPGVHLVERIDGARLVVVPVPQAGTPGSTI